MTTDLLWTCLALVGVILGLTWWLLVMGWLGVWVVKAAQRQGEQQARIRRAWERISPPE